MASDASPFENLGVTSVTVELRGGSETWSPLISDEPWESFVEGLTARYGRARAELQHRQAPSASDEPGAYSFDY
ncbi:MAG TPA: hypothetical protein VGC78_00875 [Gaiellaceae bacterium]|jgi:hypothetical protein